MASEKSQLVSTHTALQAQTAAKEAGAYIMQRLASPETLGIEKKPDGSQVTQADLEANTRIKNRLHELTPDIPILSEEDPPEVQRAAMAKGTYWCIDPLDGTGTAIKYAQGDKSKTFFGVLIGLVKDGVPVFGVAHYPVLDGGVTYFTSHKGDKAFRQKGEEPPKIITAKKHTAGETPGVATEADVAPELVALSGQPVTPVTGLTGSRVLRTAEGAVQAGYYGHKGYHYGYWDMAALHAVLKAAGGELVGLPADRNDHAKTGAFAECKPLRYDLPPEGQDPYFSHCMAAHTTTLEHFGVSKQALSEGRHF